MRIAVRMLAGILLLFLWGCGVKEISIPAPQVIEVLDGKDTRSISVGKVVSRIPAGKKVLRGKAGMACVTVAELPMPSGGFGPKNKEAIVLAMYDGFRNANYNVLGDPSALFDENEDAMAELVVSGNVIDMMSEICLPYSRFGNSSTGSGSMTIDVEWQVYNRLDKKVVYRKKTHGASNYTFESDTSPDVYLVSQAIGNALQSLLADKAFHDLLLLDVQGEMGPLGEAPTQPLSSPAGQGGEMRRVTIHGDSSSTAAGRPIADVPRSVVTIQEGASHGTGFLISSEGYIVTNQHVVGNMTRARVIFLDGRKTDGVVLARDVKRDAALIKIDPVDVPPLKVNPSDLAVGSDVYAIGSPKSMRFAGTLTKGVVSGYRHFNGVRWIQADAAINSGNSGGPLVDAKGRVVGVTTLSRVDAQGIFFFGPIADVLNALGVQVL